MFRIKTKAICAAGLTAALTLCLAGGAAAQKPVRPLARPGDAVPLYKDASAPIPARVEDLLKRMTLAEKVAQLEAVWVGKTAIQDAQHNFDMAKAEKLYPDGIGTLARPSDLEGPVSPRVVPRRGPRATVEYDNAVQHWAVEHTRLGIPVLFHEEGLHGYATKDATSFPVPIGLASSWDPDMVRETNVVTAREMRARGIVESLSPVVDVARDPRWGRIEETFGEDPYLVGELGVAAIEGLQGDKLPLADGKVLATLKHLTGHGMPQSGTNVGPAEISERTLREVFFPPFLEAIRRTKVQAVMPSYNEIDGIPSTVNYWLLHDVLRGEWGFKGAIVSDYDAIEQLVYLHHVAADNSDAAVRALHAGVDADLPDGVAYKTLIASVKDGKVSIKQIDDAVRRILTMKFDARLFDHPYYDAAAAEAVTENADAQAVALKAAREVPVLLKNDGTLPLSHKLKTLAVIGPNAAPVRLGGYYGTPNHAVSILDGIRAKVGKTMKIVTAQGVKITENDDWWANEVTLASPAENEKLIKQAVDVARGADAVVLVIGGNAQTSREAWAPDHWPHPPGAGHPGDRDSLKLVGQQQALADALFALGKPVVVVLINGRPLAVVDVAKHANALIEGWYMGQAAGTAMADILFGDVDPSGHLPVTIPRSVGQLPIFYDQKPSAHRDYLFSSTEPLFPFGYGLSYTTFDVSAPRLSSAGIAPDGTVDVSVDIRNTGKRAGADVVQLYIRDEVSSVTRPVKELKGFERVMLAPGESRTVHFKLGPQALGFWNEQMKRVVEPGLFDIMSGDNSVDLKTTKLLVK
jgi:beta-glucosidase